MLIAVALAAPGTAAARGGGGSAEDMVRAVNKVRAGYELPPLRRSPQLKRTSQRFSSALLNSGSFGHRATIDGGAGFSALGEALAMHTGRRPAVRPTLRQWLNSPGHRAIVLSRSMRWVGTGISRGPFRGRAATIWVLRVGRG